LSITPQLLGLCLVSTRFVRKPLYEKFHLFVAASRQSAAKYFCVTLCEPLKKRIGRRDHDSQSERPDLGSKLVAGLGSQTPPLISLRATPFVQHRMRLWLTSRRITPPAIESKNALGSGTGRMEPGTTNRSSDEKLKLFGKLLVNNW
jgi:hypothetical protein